MTPYLPDRTEMYTKVVSIVFTDMGKPVGSPIGKMVSKLKIQDR